MPSVATYEGETVVPLSVEAAFDAYVDASHFHEWQRMLKRVLDLQGSTSVPGSTYVLDHGIVGKMRVDVLTVERPGLYRIRQQGLGLDVISTTRFIQVRDDPFAGSSHHGLDCGPSSEALPPTSRSRPMVN
jgi:hypothetical protein